VTPIPGIHLYPPLAHLGHWYWLVLFMLPGLLVLAGAIRTAVQERRKARQDEDSKDAQ
jgi:hypothetical protein